jgi:hypothetical protein
MRTKQSKLHLMTATVVLACTVVAAWLAADAEAAGPAVTIDNGKLLIRGTDADDRIGIRQVHSRPALLELDLDGDSVADQVVRRSRFKRIRIDSGEGFDTLSVVGSAADERFELSARGQRVRLAVDAGHLRARIHAVERLDVAARGGADTLTAGDLTGTELQEIHGDLAAPAPEGAADGELDRVLLEGSPEGEQASVLGFGGGVAVIGLPTFVQLEHADPTDRLTMRGRGGSDLLSTSTAALVQTLDGGDDVDVLLGGPGDDHLIGGADFDDVAGRQGDDTAEMGPAPDRFTWNPGDGDDGVEGGPGHDSMSFNGSADAEQFDLSASGRRLRYTRDVGGIVMDLDDVEEINTVALGGADVMTAHDLTRTDVDQANFNLTPAVGSPAGDGQPDRVVVEGTDRRDTIAVTGSGSAATVTGLSAAIGITHAEGALDTLAIDTRAGDDTVDSSGLPAGIIGLLVE